VTVGLGEMQDHQRPVVVLHALSELGDPVGDHTPGLRCRGGGVYLRVCMSAHGGIIPLAATLRHDGCGTVGGRRIALKVSGGVGRHMYAVEA